ncbi:unnamed protein product [Cochlearia groenlandica]
MGDMADMMEKLNTILEALDKATKDLAEVKAKQDFFETSFQEITTTKAESEASGKKISEDQRDMFEDAKEGQKKLGGLDDDNPKEKETFEDDLVPYSGRGRAEAARNRGRLKNIVFNLRLLWGTKLSYPENKNYGNFAWGWLIHYERRSNIIGPRRYLQR